MTTTLRNEVPMSLVRRCRTHLLAIAAGLTIIGVGCGSSAPTTSEADTAIVTSAESSPTTSPTSSPTPSPRTSDVVAPGASASSASSAARPVSTVAAPARATATSPRSTTARLPGAGIDFEDAARSLGIDSEIPRPSEPVYGIEALDNRYVTDGIGGTGAISNRFALTLTVRRNAMSQQELFDELAAQVPAACGTPIAASSSSSLTAVAGAWSDASTGAECRLLTDETSLAPGLLVYHFERQSYPIGAASLASVRGELLQAWQRVFSVPVKATGLVLTLDRNKDSDSVLSTFEILAQWTTDGTVDAVLDQFRSAANPTLVLDPTSTDGDGMALPFHDASAPNDMAGRVQLVAADDGVSVTGSTFIRITVAR